MRMSDKVYYGHKREEVEKTDHSSWCDKNDENKKNDCWHCTRFSFPIGCMYGEE